MKNRVQGFTLLAGIIIGAFLTLWGVTALPGKVSPVAPFIVEGYAGSNHDGTAIGVSAERDGLGEGYNIAGARWREFGGSWHDNGTPPSLIGAVSGVKVRLGVIIVASANGAPGGPVVSWIEILSN